MIKKDQHTQFAKVHCNLNQSRFVLNYVKQLLISVTLQSLKHLD